MRKMLLVFGYELGSTFRRRSYLFATFAIPIIIGVIFLGLSSLQRSAPSAPTQSTSAPTELRAEGYVDYAGLIHALSPDVPPGTLVPYEDEVQAQQALRAGEITAYYVIPADYIASGDLIHQNLRILPLSLTNQVVLLSFSPPGEEAYLRKDLLEQEIIYDNFSLLTQVAGQPA